MSERRASHFGRHGVLQALAYGAHVLHQVPAKGIPHPPLIGDGRQSCDGDGDGSSPSVAVNQEYVTEGGSTLTLPSFFSAEVDIDLDYSGKDKFFLHLS